MSAGISPKLPIVVSKAGGCVGPNTTLSENTKQNLKNLLLTSPGERVMIPDFGVGIRNYLFENESTEVVAELQNRIATQVETYMPMIVLVDLNVSIQEHVLNIRVVYGISGVLSSDVLDLSLDVNSIR